MEVYGGRLINGPMKGRTKYSNSPCIAVLQYKTTSPFIWTGLQVRELVFEEPKINEVIYVHYTHPLTNHGGYDNGFWYTGELPSEPYLSILLLRYGRRQCESCQFFEHISDWGSDTGECKNQEVLNRLDDIKFTGYIGVSTSDYCNLWDQSYE